MNMSYGLLTGDVFNWTTNVPFPDGIYRALLHNSPRQRNTSTGGTDQLYDAVSAWCAVTVEGDRNRDLGSPR